MMVVVMMMMVVVAIMMMTMSLRFDTIFFVMPWYGVEMVDCL